jgi:hypothetical protein
VKSFTEVEVTMFFNNVPNVCEFPGDINVGDLIELDPSMMLVDPQGPVLVVDADNDKGFYGVTYTAFRYDVGVSRIDIIGIVNESR